MFALVDCNSFYASCEKVFRPDLADSPVVVLSNNDGCIVAMSREARSLNIPRGAPFFKVESMLKNLGASVFSSNYALYGDISGRVMDLLSLFSPQIEVYSIDEAFLILQGSREELLEIARQIRKRVRKWIGIPVSVGLARSKTLAKIVAGIAKKSREGVFLLKESDEDSVLLKTDVRDVWGIGSQHGKFLRSRKIHTAWDLKNAEEYWVKKNLTLVGLKMQWELKGKPSFTMEEEPPPKQGIMSSRSFSYPVTEKSEILEAGSEYAAAALEKLHSQNSVCGIIQTSITTNPFKTHEKQYRGSLTFELEVPDDYPPRILKIVREQLEKLYRPGFRYKKVAVYLSGIEARGSGQLHLFDAGDERENAVLEAVNQIKRKYGKHTLHCQGNRGSYKWTMKREKLSPRYTTHWDDLPLVRAI